MLEYAYKKKDKKVINEATLKALQRNGKNCEKNLKIKEYLNDEAFFYKIDKNNALKILLMIGVKSDQIEIVYNKLVNISVFYRLINEKKININDKNIIIKF